MRNSKDLIGKSVVSIDEGRVLGTVRDVYLDQNLQWLAGVHLGKEGLLSRRSLLIPREAIVVFGADVVLAKTSDVVTDDKKLPESETWLRLDGLQGRGVDTTGGTKVGVIGDAILDEEARIVGFSLSRVYVEGPVAESRTIYQEAIVDNGQQDGTMTVDLKIVEQQSHAEEPLAVPPPPKSAEEPFDPVAEPLEPVEQPLDPAQEPFDSTAPNVQEEE